jgi:hypothetical protein
VAQAGLVLDEILADLFYKGKAALNCVFNAEPQIDVSYVQQP